MSCTWELEDRTYGVLPNLCLNSTVALIHCQCSYCTLPLVDFTADTMKLYRAKNFVWPNANV